MYALVKGCLRLSTQFLKIEIINAIGEKIWPCGELGEIWRLQKGTTMTKRDKWKSCRILISGLLSDMQSLSLRPSNNCKKFYLKSILKYSFNRYPFFS